ncbi:hypothetical protein IWQ54_004651 [Labrenzia sp. EL_195]|nr:hypothetical protein [Labrenzia sp. EL_195]
MIVSRPAELEVKKSKAPLPTKATRLSNLNRKGSQAFLNNEVTDKEKTPSF